MAPRPTTPQHQNHKLLQNQQQQEEIVEILREAEKSELSVAEICRTYGIADKDSTGILTDVHESLGTHRIVFAAEQSRREKRQVELLPHGS